VSQYEIRVRRADRVRLPKGHRPKRLANSSPSAEKSQIRLAPGHRVSVTGQSSPGFNDEDTWTLVSIALELEGHNVVAYKDGAFALTAFDKSLPDLAIVEIEMPRIDGIEMLLLRRSSDVPVIFVTCKMTRLLWPGRCDQSVTNVT